MTFRFALNPRWDALGTTTSVLAGAPADYHVCGYTTTLTIKSVTQGRADYRTPHGSYRIDSDRFVLFNHQQIYDMDVANRPPNTRTLCLFFQPGLVESVAHALTSSEAQLMDDYAAPAPVTLEFPERSHPKVGPIALLLSALNRRIEHGQADPVFLEDTFYSAAEMLVRIRERMLKEIVNFPGRRASTRTELYRRLHYARDYIQSCFDGRLDVAKIAAVACLSPYHFQRSYKQAFGISPMQAVQQCRLVEARRLLASTDRPVGEICLDVGFDSPSSFSTLFRSHYGLAPSAFRRRSRK